MNSVSKIKKRNNQYLTSEINLLKHKNKSGTSVCLGYPDFYENGAPNLGVQALYREISRRPDSYADRVFLPDQDIQETYMKSNIPLISFENQTQVKGYDILAFTISFEELSTNILSILDLAKIPLRSKNRCEKHPLVVGGGPFVSYNPEPLADFFDAIVVGEGEELIHEFIDVYDKNKGKNREQLLTALSLIDGIYIPSHYDFEYNKDGLIQRIKSKKDGLVKRRWIKNFNENPAHSIFITNKSIYREPAYSIEVQRGCGKQCRFCYMGYNLRKSRVVDIKKLDELFETGREKTDIIKLFFEGISDEYANVLFEYLEDKLKDEKTTLRLGSIRADLLDEKRVEIIAKSGQKCLILAPETAEGYQRNLINKNKITDEQIFNAVKWSAKYGIDDFGLYLMLGLPNENITDIKNLASLIKNTRDQMDNIGNKKGVLEIHLNAFFPKPFTPLQWAQMIDMDDAKKKYEYLIENLKGYDIVDEKINKTLIGAGYLTASERRSPILMKTLIDTKTMFSQPILSRGDRRISKIIEFVYKNGDTIDIWKTAFKKFGMDYSIYFRKKSLEEILPWSIVDTGVSNDYLKKEWVLALEGAETLSCEEKCGKCGVC